MHKNTHVIMALDVGAARIGVAITPPGVMIAQPFKTLMHDIHITETIRELITSHNVTDLVVGNPRNLQGKDTDQTRYVHSFVDGLRAIIKIPIHLQDEALTSVKAEDELKERQMPYEKADVDALAATYILNDYIEENYRVAHA